jgi:ornithine cyclodeaminase
MTEKLNVVPFVSVDHMMKLVLAIGIERFLTELAAYVEEDFRRWEQFDKTPRIASHSHDGVIELMPTSDGHLYGFKYVNGHPKNTRDGRQTVTAFGVLADVGNGYPMLLTEMTILTALRTAATSAVAAKYLAPARGRHHGHHRQWRPVGVPGHRLQGLLGIDKLRLYDIDAGGLAEMRREPCRHGLRHHHLQTTRRKRSRVLTSSPPSPPTSSSRRS